MDVSCHPLGRPRVKGAVTYSPAFAVPSAWRGLTSLFGMGRGGSPALSPPWSFLLFPGPVPGLPAAGGVRGKKPWRPEAGLFSLQVLARPIHDIIASCPCLVLSCGCIPQTRQGWWMHPQERVRAISIARLYTLPHLHLRPIDVVVFDDPMWRSYLGEGFVLRCFQHLS